jgi:hypothetical protein
VDNCFVKLKIVFFWLFVFSACVFYVKGQPSAENPQSAIRNPQAKVLVELYTAEGCPTCPPAGRALVSLQKEQPAPNTEIITLAFHVDYWNERGWTDKFSSPLFSQRQQYYTNKFKIGASYTPQMIVDGNYEFVGSNLEKAKQFIGEASKITKAKIQLELNEQTLKVNISEIPKHTDATIYLAIAEDNLSSEVAKGKNSTLKLEHISVVRELRLIGNLPATNQSFSAEHQFQIQPDWKKENLKLVVFIQEKQSRKIIGVNSAALVSN